MAVRGAFSSMLITAQRHWWKDILKLWRRSAVFSLSFDYIPNYSASKQLNEAWMLWADSVCNWTMLLYFEHPTALISHRRLWVCVRERERDVWWNRVVHEAAKPALITRVNSVRMTSSCMARWVHDVMIGALARAFDRACTCGGWERLSVRTVLVFTVTPQQHL